MGPAPAKFGQIPVTSERELATRGIAKPGVWVHPVAKRALVAKDVVGAEAARSMGMVQHRGLKEGDLVPSGSGSSRDAHQALIEAEMSVIDAKALAAKEQLRAQRAPAAVIDQVDAEAARAKTQLAKSV